MSVNFNKTVQPQPVVASKVAMPVGTSIILAMDKFMFDKRDQNCKSCRNGYRSTLPKMLDGKMYSVSVICTCVPYYQSSDADGTGVVIYKGRRENWTKGVRPEAEIQSELIREGDAQSAFKQKMNPKSTPQNTNGKNSEANQEKAAQNAAKPAQKVMQQDKQGHWLFVTLEEGKKMGLSISDVSNPLVNPDNPEKGIVTPQTPPAQPQEQAKGLRPESDEEFLIRTTGQAPMTADPRVITEEEATKIEADRVSSPVAIPPASGPSVPAPVAPAPTNQSPAVVKRGPGRPKGSVKKK